MRMRGLQKINHFPGMHAICRKGDLARSLSRMQVVCESSGNGAGNWISRMSMGLVLGGTIG